MPIYIFLIGLLTGTLIGTVGIGGILLAPLLSYLLGVELHLAMATSSMSFLFTGVMGTISYARKKSISWEMAKWLSLGIIPATVIGARVNVSLPTNVLTIILAILITYSGVNALISRPTPRSTQMKLSKIGNILIGLEIGFGSALTGTGGPVLLVPLLIYLEFPALAAIGVSQAIQLPIAIFATFGFLLYGQIDVGLGLYLGVVQAIGVILGAKVAHGLPSEKLHQVVALAMIGVGCLMLGRMIL